MFCVPPAVREFIANCWLGKPVYGTVAETIVCTIASNLNIDISLKYTHMQMVIPLHTIAGIVYVILCEPVL
jgi:hypothetical protein